MMIMIHFWYFIESNHRNFVSRFIVARCIVTCLINRSYNMRMLLGTQTHILLDGVCILLSCISHFITICFCFQTVSWSIFIQRNKKAQNLSSHRIFSNTCTIFLGLVSAGHFIEGKYRTVFPGVHKNHIKNIFLTGCLRTRLKSQRHVCNDSITPPPVCKTE